MIKHGSCGTVSLESKKAQRNPNVYNNMLLLRSTAGAPTCADLILRNSINKPEYYCKYLRPDVARGIRDILLKIALHFKEIT